MHILVPIQRVIDHNVKIRVKSDGSGVETTGVKMSMNPFDEVAVEQAIRLKEAGMARQVTVVAWGAAVAQDVLRTALAMGTDAAVLIEVGADAPDSLGAARLLKAMVERTGATLVLCGKQAIDDDLGATGPMLAALLDWPQAVSVSQLAFESGQVLASCDGDGGLEQWSLNLPAVLSVDLRLCDPRRISLPAMMKAKKAVITTLAAAELATAAAPLATVTSVADPAARAPGRRVATVDALIDELKQRIAATV